MARYDAAWGRGRGFYGAPVRSSAPRWAVRGRLRRARRRRQRAGAAFGRPVATRRSGATVYGPAATASVPTTSGSAPRRRSDDELREEVEEALFYDTWVDAEAVKVEAKDGVVTLRGELPDYEEIRYATDDAWDVDGVLGRPLRADGAGALAAATGRSAAPGRSVRSGVGLLPPGRRPTIEPPTMAARSRRASARTCAPRRRRPPGAPAAGGRLRRVRLVVLLHLLRFARRALAG